MPNKATYLLDCDALIALRQLHAEEARLFGIAAGAEAARASMAVVGCQGAGRVTLAQLFSAY